MAVGALIGAYQENDLGELRALLPLAGRTLIEYQARCVAAAGAAPIVVLVERVPPALHEALERLRADGLSVIPVSDGNEAASRFEAGSLILLVGDGVAAPAELLAQLAEEPEPAVATVPDDEPHEGYERIDATSRWAGVALVDGRTLGATAAMLGDWDLQSTLLRRALQDGALRVRVSAGGRAVAGRKRRPAWRVRARPDRLVARRAARLGEPLCAAGGRGVRHRAAAGDAGSSAMAGLDGARR